MSEPQNPEAKTADDSAEGAAAAFEEDEKTSPEVVRQRGAKDGVTPDSNPRCVVAVADEKHRRKLVELLWADGWNAIEATDADELLEMARSVTPQVVLVDAHLESIGGTPVAEALKHQRPDVAMRAVGLLQSGASFDIASALADGFDDFVNDPHNEVEVLARATSNLRASRVLAQTFKQRRDAALLLELSQTLASSLDMQLILHTVSRLIAEVIEFERCSIVLLDPDHDDALMVAASEDRSVRDLPIRLSNYPELKRCVESAAPVLISDAAADPILDGVRMSVVDKGVRTMALFPIVFEERVTGVLFLRSTRPAKRLSDHEVQFGQTVASACAVAIRNARLFDQFRDQTERINSMRVQAERQTEALRKYQDFFEYAADGMAIIDADSMIRYVNREGRRLLGRLQDDLKHVRFGDLLAQESQARWLEVVDQVRHGRFKRAFDTYVARGDGEERVISLSAGGGGQETGLIILSFRDVTETREMEGELRTTKEFLENLIDNSVDAIVASDMNGNIMLFNKGAERIYGYRAEDVIGRMHVSQLYQAGQATDVMRKLRDERWGGRGRLEAHRRDIVGDGGDHVPVSMTASIIYEDGDEVATVGVFTDLRDRINVERRLAEAQDQLTKVEKARVAAELAGMAAHELNQPLTSVLGYAEMLKGRVAEDDVRLRRPVETIFKQAERMAEIVRKIGRITKYETKPYGANTDMIDLERATGGEGGLHAAAITLSSLPPQPPLEPSDEGFAARGRGESGDEPVTLPPMRALGPQASQPPQKGLMATLASMPQTKTPPSSGRSGAPVDPRAAVVRMDTVEERPSYARSVREMEKRQLERPHEEDETNRFVASRPTSGVHPAPPIQALGNDGAPLPRSLAVSDVPQAGDGETEHTNPGMRLQDGRRRRGSEDVTADGKPDRSE